MEPLRTLVIAGIKHEKGTFIGLSILLFLTGLALTFTINLFTDLTERESVLLDEVGAGDVFANDLPANLDEEALSEIRALPEVGEVRVTHAFSAATRFEDASGHELREEALSSSNAYEAWGTSLDFNVLDDDLQGYQPDSQGPAEGEVYVRPACKVLFGLGIGDQLVLNLDGEEVRLRVAGFYEDPQLGSPFLETTRSLISKADFDRLLEKVESIDAQVPAKGDASIMAMGDIPYPITEINVFLAPAARAAGLTGQDLSRMIGDETKWGGTANALFARETLAGYTLMVVQVMVAILGVFSLLLFIVALILCLHTASTAIESGYADWGIMKGVGLSKATLRSTLIWQYAACAFVGLVAGFIVGCVLEPLLWPPYLLITGVLVQDPPIPFPALTSCTVLFIGLCLCVVVKAQKIGRISPLAALRQGEGDVRFAPRGTNAIGGDHLVGSLAWRSIMSEKGRYLGLGFCSLLLCAFISLCIGIGGAVEQDDAVYEAFGVWKSDISVDVSSGTVEMEEVRDVIDGVASIERMWQEGATMLNLNGEARTFVGLSDTDVISNASLISGRKPIEKNEALVGLSMARSLGLDVGDEFTVADQEGKEHDYVVSGVLSSVLNGGNGIILTYEGLEDLAGTAMMSGGDSWQIQLEESAMADEAIAEVQARFGEEVDTEPTGLFGSATNMILLVRNLLTMIGYGMVAFAIALACVAVMLVSHRMLASEQKDLGVYRALGFSVRSLRASFSLRFLVVSLAGALVGVMITMAFGSPVTGALFGMFGAGSFIISLPWWKALIISVGFAMVFTAAAYAFSRGIKRVSVRALVSE